MWPFQREKEPSPLIKLHQMEMVRCRREIEEAQAQVYYFRTMHRHLADICFSTPDHPVLIEVEERAAHEVSARFPNTVLRRL